MDSTELDENMKQLQEYTIVKSTFKKMFGNKATNGKDSYKYESKLVNNNLAYIKRKLDEEFSDKSRIIRRMT